MIFPRYQIGRMLKGRMTETRRRIQPDEEECRFQPGRSYAVQNPKGRSLTRMLVLEVDRGLLSDVDDDAAQRMGYATAEDYFEWWREQYGDGPLIEIPVWVIRFELDTVERPRYLAAHAGKLARGDYTLTAADALDGDAPAIDEATQERYSMESGQEKVARIADYERHIRERPLYDQLRDALDEAQRAGVDTARYEARIASGVEALRARTRRDVAA